jgi:hypothetical protein
MPTVFPANEDELPSVAKDVTGSEDVRDSEDDAGILALPDSHPLDPSNWGNYRRGRTVNPIGADS